MIYTEDGPLAICLFFSFPSLPQTRSTSWYPGDCHSLDTALPDFRCSSSLCARLSKSSLSHLTQNADSSLCSVWLRLFFRVALLRYNSHSKPLTYLMLQFNSQYVQIYASVLEHFPFPRRGSASLSHHAHVPSAPGPRQPLVCLCFHS